MDALGSIAETHVRAGVLATARSMLRKRSTLDANDSNRRRCVTVTHAHDRQWRRDRAERVSLFATQNDLRLLHYVQVSVRLSRGATMTHILVHVQIRAGSRMRGCLVCLMVA